MIDSLQALEALYAAPGERAQRKEMSALDAHALRFIALSPFVVLASADDQGRMDASPRGGAPGFVKAESGRLWIADAPGNNRLDTLRNIVASSRLGLLFLIPGVEETLRVNGRARLDDSPATCARHADARRTPKLVIELTVEQAYLHCAKAFMRSGLWQPQSLRPRSVLPTMGRMLADQTGLALPQESDEQMRARYAADL